ncbi:class D sortase [Oceanobacillus polygoni]|uniref:Sortase A n=1 Tax=Oceanobacillus polygoni TaxID=1235259 RepID=A0A9X0YU61_9BACI|nr:class D sortase [Oceanobacillus polygoni]MBP2078887.1 sortase A [Oceanobacillus polygoni]
MKKISLFIIVIGFAFLAFGGFQWYQTKMAQKESMAEAQALLDEKEFSTNDLTEEQQPEIAKEFSPDIGETVGILHIPKLEADLPIVEGTHEDELAKGVGHYRGTAYPLQNDQIVLSGHRDTVFRRMGELEIGDILTIQLPYGEFSYEITNTKIVDAEDRTIIVPHDEEVLTLTTCYPFSFIGSAPDRYIITALPVSTDIK